MKVPGLELGEWLRRLIVRRPGWSPEMLETIQPVQVVSDATGLVPPLLPATALAGGFHTSGALNFWAAEFQSLGPRGTFIRGFRIGTATATVALRFGIRTTPLTFAIQQLSQTYNLAPDPVRSRLTLGETAAGTFGLDDPHLLIPNLQTISMDDLLFVPAGSFFQLEVNFAAAFGMYVHMTWQEVA